jgi:hypothetical protein
VVNRQFALVRTLSFVLRALHVWLNVGCLYKIEFKVQSTNKNKLTTDH